MTTSTYEQLQKLAADFWAWRANNQPVSSDDIPRIERPGDWVPDWSPQAIDRRRRELTDLAKRHQEFDSKSWPVDQQVDYRLIGSALARAHFELNVICIHERNPGFYVDQTLGLLFLSLLRPPPFTEPRSRDIIRALQSFSVTVQHAKENLSDTAIRPFALAAIEKLVDVRDRLTRVANELGPKLSGVSTAELIKATSAAILALESLHDWLNARLGEMT